MSRFAELSGTLPEDLWNAVTSDPPVLTRAVASALQKALEASTAAPPAAPATPAPRPNPPTPWGTPAQPLQPQTDIERVIAGVEYAPPPGGWPTPANPQPKDIGNGEGTPYQWIATGSKGSGFYAYRVEKPLVNINATASPRSGLGLLAVFMEVGISQEFRNKAYAAIMAGGGTADTINANLQADPEWNGQVARMLAGAAPDTPELVAAKAVADAL